MHSFQQIVLTASINFTLVDLRSEPAIIGYMDNIFEMRIKKTEASDPDITKSIRIKYKNKFSKKSFKFSKNANDSNLKLTLTISTFLAEIRPDLVDVATQADICMNASLVSGKENIKTYKLKNNSINRWKE
jgi:hypothetical protein